MAHRAGQRLGCVAAEPDRRMRPLHRLGLDRQVVDVAEPAVKRHPRFVGPGRLHQFQALGETADEGGLVHAERRELAEAAAWRDADVQPAVAEPVDGGHSRGQLKRIMQRRHQHRDAQPQPLGAGRARTPAVPAAPTAVRRRRSVRAPSRPRTRVPRRGPGRRADRRASKPSESSWGIEMENLTPPPYGPRTAAAVARLVIGRLKYVCFPARPAGRRRGPRTGSPGRHRPPPRRTQRLRARTGSARRCRRRRRL